MRDDGLEIRGYSTADADPIADIIISSFRTSFAGIVPPEECGERWAAATRTVWRSYPPGDRGVRVATSQGVVVGYVRGNRPPRFATADATTEIFDMHVAPARRREGIGRALVADFLALARAEGWAPVVGWTLERNVGAAQFYRALGGTEVCRYSRQLYGRAFEEIGFRLPDSI